MHDESDIIGHITDSILLDENGAELKQLGETTKFDIATSAVLYNSWTTPELKEWLKLSQRLKKANGLSLWSVFSITLTTL